MSNDAYMDQEMKELNVTRTSQHQLLAFNFSKRILFRSFGFALPFDSFIT